MVRGQEEFLRLKLTRQQEDVFTRKLVQHLTAEWWTAISAQKFLADISNPEKDLLWSTIRILDTIISG